MITFRGHWRITVVTKSALFDQRLVVRTGMGIVIIPGNEGTSQVIDDAVWSLSLEHNHWGKGWRSNVRVTPGPACAHAAGGRSQEIWSTDWDFEGHDPNRRNLVIRLDQIVNTEEDPTPPVLNPAGTVVQIPAAAPAIRTTSASDAPAGSTSSYAPTNVSKHLVPPSAPVREG